MLKTSILKSCIQKGNTFDLDKRDNFRKGKTFEIDKRNNFRKGNTFENVQESNIGADLGENQPRTECFNERASYCGLGPP